MNLSLVKKIMKCSELDVLKVGIYHQLFFYGGGKYGAPFVTSILLLTEANFVQQKSLLSDKSNFVYVRQNYFCQTKVDFVRQK